MFNPVLSLFRAPRVGTAWPPCLLAACMVYGAFDALLLQVWCGASPSLTRRSCRDLNRTSTLHEGQGGAARAAPASVRVNFYYVVCSRTKQWKRELVIAAMCLKPSHKTTIFSILRSPWRFDGSSVGAVRLASVPLLLKKSCFSSYFRTVFIFRFQCGNSTTPGHKSASVPQWVLVRAWFQCKGC